MKTGQYKWSFEELDDAEYQLVLTYKADRKQFNKLFKLTLNKLKRKHGLKDEINANPDVIEEFEIPDSQKKTMFPLILRAIKKNVDYVFSQVKEDKSRMKVISGDVVKVRYINKSCEGWFVEITIKGGFSE